VSGDPLRVVIAEDEALIRLDLKEMLEEEGYSVVAESGDGESAVDSVTSLRPDLVILDIKMPVLDGISAAERIAVDRIAPVVILTAFSQRELVERARDAGAMAYLVKPFTKADLVPAIEMAVSRFAEIRALDTEVDTLRERLEVRKLLDRAKGLLQSEHGLSEPAAFRWIQKTSMDRRLTMRAVAEAVIAGGVNVAADPELLAGGSCCLQQEPGGAVGAVPAFPGRHVVYLNPPGPAGLTLATCGVLCKGWLSGRSPHDQLLITLCSPK
jgi:two-component system, response regulator PdtaR